MSCVAEPKPFCPNGAADVRLYLNTGARHVDRALDQYLPSARSQPTTLHRAMRYSLFAGGKRLRPGLCLAAADACGGAPEQAIPLACAVECIHTYSLIHDDLPAMDNDDFRRGRPTCHKAFGEAVAILAGDALLTLAFEIAAKCRGSSRYAHADIIGELARAAGSRRLVGGQVADLEAEGRNVTPVELRHIHERKTAALLCCSVRLGGMIADCKPRILAALTEFGYCTGLAFQVIDDLLDVTQSSRQLGKTAGKDQASRKATYPALVGLDRSRRIAASLTDRAFAALKPLGRRAALMEALGRHLLKRDH